MTGGRLRRCLISDRCAAPPEQRTGADPAAGVCAERGGEPAEKGRSRRTCSSGEMDVLERSLPAFETEVRLVKRELGPDWSDKERAAGKRLQEAWEEFFARAETTEGPSREPHMSPLEDSRIAAVQARHEAELLRYPNVVGVAPGVRMTHGKPTGERCLVVYVERKIPRTKLREDEVLPHEIEGVPVDVVEVGRVEPLPI